jgi:ferredoxin
MLPLAALQAKLTLTSMKSPGRAGARRPPMPEPRRLRVHVDPEKCQGHNRCKALAPELFDLDELGNARAVGDGRVPAGLEEKAYLAKSNCPEFAIEIIEE